MFVRYWYLSASTVSGRSIRSAGFVTQWYFMLLHQLFPPTWGRTVILYAVTSTLSSYMRSHSDTLCCCINSDLVHEVAATHLYSGSWVAVRVSWHSDTLYHSCQPLLGVNLSPEFVNLYFPYAGRGLLFFCWWQRHFEFRPAHVAVEGRRNVVRNTHERLQISLLTRFLSLLH